MNKERLKALKRLLPTLSEEEAFIVKQKFEAGQPTGYATVDRPGDEYYKDVEKKDLFVNTTLYEGLRLANKDYPDEKAIEYFGTNISFGKLLHYNDVVAKSLEEYGVKKGKFLTVCSTTTPEVIYTLYGLSKQGAAVNAISPFYTPEQLMGRINECESEVIIIADKFYEKFKNVLNRDKSKTIVVLPLMNSSILKYFQKGYKVDGKTNEVSWKTFIKDGSYRQDTDMCSYEPNMPQAMVYSSGTTGPSKGIVLSVDSFQKLVNAYGNSGFDTSRKQKVYHNAPPWSSTGLSLGINFPLSYGVKLCIDPRFEQDVFVDNILRFKPEYVLSDTSMYQGFTTERNLEKLKGKSLSFLKYPVEGGEHLPEKDVEAIENVFKTHGSNARLLNGYGQCECGATITTDITSKKFSNNASGIPLPDIVTVGIFDDNFRELKYGERGNIAAITEIGMIEYYDRPKETEEFFYTDINGDKWSMTGDVGYINEDGSLVVLGRKSDYSIINGEHIFNFDVEQAILECKDVRLCEVQTHPEDNNKLVAHIVWESDARNDISENPENLNEYLLKIQDIVLKITNNANYVPNCFCIRDKFPTASSGKRDWQAIKNNVEGIIEIDNTSIRKK